MTLVLGLAGSPRRGGNTDILLEWVLEAAGAAGARTVRLCLCDLEISGCRACDACFSDGRCIVDDGMQELYPYLRTAEAVVVAAPIYSMGLNAQTKAMIDRCQPFWAEKYVLGRKRAEPCDPQVPGCRGLDSGSAAGAAVRREVSAGRSKGAVAGLECRGAFLSCAGTSFGDTFEGAERTIAYLWHVLDVTSVGALLLPGVDQRGEVGRDPAAREKAHELGRLVAGAGVAGAE